MPQQYWGSVGTGARSNDVSFRHFLDVLLHLILLVMWIFVWTYIGSFTPLNHWNSTIMFAPSW